MLAGQSSPFVPNLGQWEHRAHFVQRCGPMTVFLEPETLMPFFGGTYFPKHGGGRRPAFADLLRERQREWTDERAGVSAKADRIAQQITKTLARQVEPQPVAEKLLACASRSGFRTLREAALERALTGEISLDELARVTAES